MAADSSKSHSNSITSTQSLQSGHSVFSGGSVVANMGSMRNMCNQSSQMRHARNVSRRLTANFDVGSFQWKKDAKLMSDNFSGVYLMVIYIFSSKSLRYFFQVVQTQTVTVYCRILPTLNYHV